VVSRISHTAKEEKNGKEWHLEIYRSSITIGALPAAHGMHNAKQFIEN